MDDEDDAAFAVWDLVADLRVLLNERMPDASIIEAAYLLGVSDGIAAAILDDSRVLKL